MGIIKLLDEEVSQLIAAGEVVERPSSVVKELVENSIDAGASKVTIEIRHGGVTMIRVSDNGSGIAPEDVPVMFLRHATSKVRTQEDLGHIATLGFRGEAMASIHAVARVEVLTRKQDSDEGVCYRGEGAQTGQVQPAGCPAGTTVKVQDLFYNTPARMKFLKKDVQEGNAVAAVVERIALSHPEISFQFIREGQTRLHTPGDGKLLSAVHAVFGRDFTKDLAEVDYTQGQIHVGGYVTLPSASRSNRTMQTFFFTNERPVFDAVYYGVKSALAKSDYTPLPPQQPKKPMTVFDLERRPEVEQQALEQIIRQQQPKQQAPQRMTAQEYRQMVGEKPAKPKIVRQEEKLTFHDHSPQRVQWEREHPLLLVEEPRFAQKPQQPQPVAPKSPAEESLSIQEWEPLVEEAADKPAPQLTVEWEQPEPEPEQQEEKNNLRLVGEVLGIYLVVESDDRMILIDKHAAHERLIFNRLKQRRFTDDRQLLLEPVVVHLSREDYQGAVQNLPLFEQAGFLVEEFGDGDLIVREVPVMLLGAEVKEIIEQTAHDLSQNKKDTTPHALDDLLHSVACKSAVRANDKNTLPELWEIVQLLRSDSEAKYCPHGRPIARIFTRYELEKLFGRQG